jgi:hypothetical protein
MRMPRLVPVLVDFGLLDSLIRHLNRMPFPPQIKTAIDDYVSIYTGDDTFYQNYFWFISAEDLRKRLTDEFKSARFVYKVLEGMEAEDWLLTAEAKIQILLYASIYEAILHHVLFTHYKNTSEVDQITHYDRHVTVNVSAAIRANIVKTAKPKGPLAIFEVKREPVDERKIVFETKARTAHALGLLDSKLKQVVIDVYSLRNAIHLHAELKRSIQFDIAAARDAYWHLQGFCRQISKRLVLDKKILPQPVTPSEKWEASLPRFAKQIIDLTKMV